MSSECCHLTLLPSSLSPFFLPSSHLLSHLLFLPLCSPPLSLLPSLSQSYFLPPFLPPGPILFSLSPSYFIPLSLPPFPPPTPSPPPPSLPPPLPPSLPPSLLIVTQDYTSSVTFLTSVTLTTQQSLQKRGKRQERCMVDEDPSR